MDAYLAVMMPSDVPFNGASNDATTGRARSADQRNLLTYLRGKVDTRRDPETGGLRDVNLRGDDQATWGAAAVTFRNDDERRFTVLRAYIVPKRARGVGDIQMTMATVDDTFDLRRLEEFVPSRFHHLELTGRVPGLVIRDTYQELAYTLQTRLGIGDSGGGNRAMRLLARIQAGQHLPTVDALYKSLVLETPGTYEAADRALAHFAALDDAYEAMDTEERKVRILSPITELHLEISRARAAAEAIDGIATGAEVSPFAHWTASRKRALLDAEVERNGRERTAARGEVAAAEARHGAVEIELRDAEARLRDQGGNALAQLEDRIERRTRERDAVVRTRTVFDERTAPLGLTVSSEREFSAAQRASHEFLGAYAASRTQLDERRDALTREEYPLLDRERPSARSGSRWSTGRARCRCRCTRHASRWRGQRASTRRSCRSSRSCSTCCPVRTAGDPRSSPCSPRGPDPARRRGPARSVQRRDRRPPPPRPHPVRGCPDRAAPRPRRRPGDGLRQAGDQALAVQHVGAGADRVGSHRRPVRGLRRRTRWWRPTVTVAGQLRDGRRGAHGDRRQSNVIGFTNEARVASVEQELGAIAQDLATLEARRTDVAQDLAALDVLRAAHQHVVDVTWEAIDVAGLERSLAQLEEERQALLAADDGLRTLRAAVARLRTALDEAADRRAAARLSVTRLEERHAVLVDGQDAAAEILARFEDTPESLPDDEQSRLLAETFEEVGAPDGIDGFDDATRRLRRRLEERLSQALDGAAAASNALTLTFQRYQDAWHDPNLGPASRRTRTTARSSTRSSPPGCTLDAPSGDGGCRSGAARTSSRSPAPSTAPSSRSRSASNRSTRSSANCRSGRTATG